MTITFISSTVSTATAVATACPVNYPVTIAAGDGLVMIVGTKPFGATITTPAGWTAQGTTTNGTTAVGIDTGSVKVAAFTKTADGTEAGAGFITVSVATADSTWVVICRYTKSAANSWSFASATGTDAAVGTAWSVAFSSNPGITVGDNLVLGGVQPTDAANTWSAHTLTAASATVGAPTGRQNPRVTTGNDSGGHVATAVCSAGTATGVPTWAATQTLATNNAGSAALVRLREVAPAGNVPAPYVAGQEALSRSYYW